MSDPASSPAEVFTGLRDRLFHGDLSRLAPGSGPPASSTEQELIGVAMEVALDRGTYLVYGLRDGSASIYLSTGGGSIGGQGQPSINAAAKKLVEAARPFLPGMPRVEELPLPAPGRVRFSLLTSAGVHAAETDEAELMSRRGELLPVFAAAQEILTAFRRFERREPGDESSYVNCLLTALARGTAVSATLIEGSPPPDPAGLTADATDLAWIAELGFVLDRLSTSKIIHSLLKLAGFRWFHLGKAEGRIQVKLAAHGGKSVSDARFRVLRRRRGGRVEMEIAPVRPPG